MTQRLNLSLKVLLPLGLSPGWRFYLQEKSFTCQKQHEISGTLFAKPNKSAARGFIGAAVVFDVKAFAPPLIEAQNLFDRGLDARLLQTLAITRCVKFAYKGCSHCPADRGAAPPSARPNLPRPRLRARLDDHR